MRAQGQRELRTARPTATVDARSSTSEITFVLRLDDEASCRPAYIDHRPVVNRLMQGAANPPRFCGGPGRLRRSNAQRTPGVLSSSRRLSGLCLRIVGASKASRPRGAAQYSFCEVCVDGVRGLAVIKRRGCRLRVASLLVAKVTHRVDPSCRRVAWAADESGERGGAVVSGVFRPLPGVPGSGGVPLALPEHRCRRW
jgi:hypothetical protein